MGDGLDEIETGSSRLSCVQVFLKVMGLLNLFAHADEDDSHCLGILH
jgi:hypothetical protein